MEPNEEYMADCAFPHETSSCDESGLTKRELLAGMAMQGLLANPVFADWTAERSASQAVSHADELLKQLNQ